MVDASQSSTLYITSPPALLLEAFNKLNRQAAKGVDNLSWQDYAKECEQRLTIIHEQLQSGRYKPFVTICGIQRYQEILNL